MSCLFNYYRNKNNRVRVGWLKGTVEYLTDVLCGRKTALNVRVQEDICYLDGREYRMH